MIILGLATMGTSAACLMRDGEIVAAIEEERLSRIKNDGAFPLRAIAECLRVAGVTMAEVDAVAVYWKRWRIGTRAAGTLGKAIASPEARKAIAARARRALVGGEAVEARPEDTGRWSDLFRIRRILKAEFGACPAEVAFHDHHLTHQLYGEATRDWPACLSLSYDGGGEADATVLTLRGERSPHRSQAHPLAELAGAFLQLLHRLARLPHARGRIQDDGARALWPADLPRHHPRTPAAPRGGRRLPARHARSATITGRWRGISTRASRRSSARRARRTPSRTRAISISPPRSRRLSRRRSITCSPGARRRHRRSTVSCSRAAARSTSPPTAASCDPGSSLRSSPPRPARCRLRRRRGAGARRRGPERPLALSRPRLHRRGDRAGLRRSRPPCPARPGRGRTDRRRRRGAHRRPHRRLVPRPHRVRTPRAGVALDPRRSARRRDPRDDQRQDQETRTLPPLRPLDDHRSGAGLVRSRPGQPLHEHPGRGAPGETRLDPRRHPCRRHRARAHRQRRGQPALSPPDHRLRRGDRRAGAAQHLIQHPGADREHPRRGHRHLAALGHGPARHRRLPLRPGLGEAGGERPSPHRAPALRARGPPLRAAR